MSEIQMNEVFAAGRISQGPIRTPDGKVHFLLRASEDQEPFHCICSDKTASNVEAYCHQGDEVSIEGVLCWVEFQRTGKILVIDARYISYGRKLQAGGQSISNG